MGLLQFLRRVVVLAFRHSLDAAQAIVFVLLIGIGIISAQLSPILRAMLPDPASWEVAGYALLCAVAMRVALAPYWAWSEEKKNAEDARSALDALRRSPEFIKATPGYTRLKMMLGPDSASSPEGRLQAAVKEFNSLEKAALAGDFEALFLATLVAEWLRESSRFYYASSPPYFHIESDMFGRLEILHKRLPR